MSPRRQTAGGMPGGAISPTGTSCHPRCRREAWWLVWRSTIVPMKTPRSRLRSTAYHIVVASRVPWIGCHGRGGWLAESVTPASTSCLRVAT